MAFGEYLSLICYFLCVLKNLLACSVILVVLWVTTSIADLRVSDNPALLGLLMSHHLLSPAILISESSAVSVLTSIPKQPVPSPPLLSTRNLTTVTTDFKSDAHVLETFRTLSLKYF